MLLILIQVQTLLTLYQEAGTEALGTPLHSCWPSKVGSASNPSFQAKKLSPSNETVSQPMLSSRPLQKVPNVPSSTIPLVGPSSSAAHVRHKHFKGSSFIFSPL